MEEEIEQVFDNDWIDFIYYEDGVKVTRFKPSWYKEPDKFNYVVKGKSRKPTFGPKDP